MPTEFKNEPLTDFSKSENRAAMEKAIEKVRGSLGKTYPLILDGKDVTGPETFASVNPSMKSEVVGQFQKATTAQLQQAITAGWRAFENWSRTAPQKRAQVIFDAASKMRRRKHEFSAWMIFETGKTWVEADADTAEAIDFMEFYAREMVRLAAPQPITKIPAEENELVYLPLGVGAVIPPWNFPLAICVGMTSAAIVSGNCVILKPASDSPAVAYQFAALMHEVGLPAGVLNYVSGSGAQIGDPLVTHPKIRFITFTGSKEVGLRINELAAKHRPGQKWIKRVVAEMGGKDAIVVDQDADIEEAATGIVAAAFGYQGQKCSACSRAILHEAVYDGLVEKIKQKTEALKIGPTMNFDTQIGPVVSGSAQKKILEYVEIGKTEGKLLTGGKTVRDDGYYIAPTVFVDVDPNARISQEEIFGPVLAITKAKDFDQALQIANNTEFGLTGAVYSKSKDHLEKARKEFFVGNLYFNRKCTGALVGVHPFGGFNMSGTDSKAGGRDYLLLFTQAKVVSEKIR
ncbi:MAG TPA: L-glutamate gamma-semialdehyde dehydrogenase [Bdellovibrionota bacterium]|nr:L-glutamate gamma-semialdehyde dehydrogenase [Bdellovibrionota bacterium]